MATHSSILAWEIPWTEEPNRLQSMGSQRAGHNLATKQPPSPPLSLAAFFISERRSWAENLRDTRPGCWATWCQIWCQLWLYIFRMKEMQDLHYFETYHLPQSSSTSFETSPYSPGKGVGHSSWGASLLCSPFAWQRTIATLSLSSRTLYFYLSLVHREPRFWQQCKWSIFFILIAGSFVFIKITIEVYSGFLFLCNKLSQNSVV